MAVDGELHVPVEALSSWSSFTAPAIAGRVLITGALCVVMSSWKAVVRLPEASSSLTSTVCVPSGSVAVLRVVLTLAVVRHGVA